MSKNTLVRLFVFFSKTTGLTGPLFLNFGHILISHRDPAVFGFSAKVSNATTTGGSYGPHMTGI